MNFRILPWIYHDFPIDFWVAPGQRLMLLYDSELEVRR